MDADLFSHSAVYSRRVRSDASKRVAFGEMAEILVCERYGATRLQTNGALGECCPDVLLPGNRPAEVKSTRDGRIVVYKFRLAKEEAQLSGSYPYFIVKHNQRATLNVEKFFAEAEVWCCTLTDILRATEGRPLKRLDSRGGYHRAGYKEGYWEVRLSDLDFPFERRTTSFVTSLTDSVKQR